MINYMHMHIQFCSKLKFITFLEIIFTNNYFLLKLINFVVNQI